MAFGVNGEKVQILRLRKITVGDLYINAYIKGYTALCARVCACVCVYAYG